MSTPAEPSFEIPTAVLHREVNGQMVLLNLETEQYFGLDEVGADMVGRLVAQPLTEVLAALTADYEVEPDILQQDLHDLIDALVGAGLLLRVNGSD